MKIDCYIIRYSEIALKGKNRPLFENKLIDNLKKMLKRENKSYENIKKTRGRIVLNSKENCVDVLKHTFGIFSFSPAFYSDNLEEDALSLYTKGTFKVETQRVDKDYPEGSQKVNERIGSYIVEKTNAKVKMKGADCVIGIEIINGKKLLYNESFLGAGGLPVGIEGEVAVYLENEESLLAAYFIMKRGCGLKLFGNKINYSLIEKYYPKDLKFFELVPKHVLAIVTNDTLENLKEYDFKIPLLKPLLGFNKNERETWLKSI
ncbi:hypothetical protein J4468_01515 [Candidatus Woesearchaeota archaeon]|nr:hypothetical protein [Candidatus Woesearchaeota archaeon]